MAMPQRDRDEAGAQIDHLVVSVRTALRPFTSCRDRPQQRARLRGSWADTVSDRSRERIDGGALKAAQKPREAQGKLDGPV